MAVLRSFSGSGGDAIASWAGLVEGPDGGLYGTTAKGGSRDGGSVFRIGKNGSGYRLIHSFAGAPGDGHRTEAPLLVGCHGRLYGVTAYGGDFEAGTVFALNPDGSDHEILHEFGGIGDGERPAAALLEGNDGLLYGTTESGGSADGGTVFRLNRTGGGYAVLCHCGASGGDPETPSAPLVEGDDGVLYGTSATGGDSGDGTVFRVRKDGSGLAVLLSFTGEEVGGEPVGALTTGSDGALYGTSYYGGDMGDGVVFGLYTDARSWFTRMTRGADDHPSPTALGAAGKTFRLLSASTLPAGIWRTVATDTASVTGSLSFTNTPSGESTCFYRMVTP